MPRTDISKNTKSEQGSMEITKTEGHLYFDYGSFNQNRSACIEMFWAVLGTNATLLMTR